MIVSASYRSDIPAFYGDWFRTRLAEGYALVANPYSGADCRVALDPAAVDGFVFWSRNPAPFRSVWTGEIEDRCAGTSRTLSWFWFKKHFRPFDVVGPVGLWASLLRCP